MPVPALASRSWMGQGAAAVFPGAGWEEGRRERWQARPAAQSRPSSQKLVRRVQRDERPAAQGHIGALVNGSQEVLAFHIGGVDDKGVVQGLHGSGCVTLTPASRSQNVVKRGGGFQLYRLLGQLHSGRHLLICLDVEIGQHRVGDGLLRFEARSSA